MAKKLMDKNQIPTIVSLDDSEITSWRSFYGGIRNKEMLPPAEYIDKAVKSLGGIKALKIGIDKPTNLIFKIRETAWDIYIEHEQLVCGKALEALLGQNPEAGNVLKTLVKRDSKELLNQTDEKVMQEKLTHLMGELNGRLFPYIYELAKSVTQSRRSRAGKAFERIIHHILEAGEVPYENQSKAGTVEFKKRGLGKLVDGLVPNLKGYEEDRAKCAILTMKTTLRERWQEVVEEIARTNVPHIFLLTLDDNITGSMMDTMRNHNITLVVPDYVKNQKTGIKNLISYETLLTQHLSYILQYWKNHK